MHKNLQFVELTKEGRRLHDKGLPLWSKAEEEFEQMNGKETAQRLKPGMRNIVIGAQAESFSD
jgi:hypothetical protein